MNGEFKKNLDQIISQEKSGRAMTDKAIKEKYNKLFIKRRFN